MSRSTSRCFAIVPAAGRSQRMGRPKLLLPWRNGTVIDQILSAWTTSGIEQVVLVARREDQALHEAARRWPITLITPETDPEDMKTSIQVGLEYLGRQYDPGMNDYCGVAPADMPALSAALIDKLIDAARVCASSDPPQIVVPQFGDRRGHPVLLPWTVTPQILLLGDDEGVNRVVDRNPCHAVSLPPQQLVSDINTPEQYERLLNKLGTT